MDDVVSEVDLSAFLISGTDSAHSNPASKLSALNKEFSYDNVMLSAFSSSNRVVKSALVLGSSSIAKV